MIILDYRTDNFRWGLSGIQYLDWQGYAFSLGYLSNIAHYQNRNIAGLIDVHIERNDLQGAIEKEGRIHYYGDEFYLQTTFTDWHRCKSAGVGNITFRINSNDYILSLIGDYGFQTVAYPGRTTLDIFPPDNALVNVWNIFAMFLQDNGVEDTVTNDLHEDFLRGFNQLP